MRGRFVQIGRVCLLNYGKVNKLCVIVNILDQNKVLIDGPKAVTGIPRQVISLKRLVLTPYVIDIPHDIHHKYLVQKFKKARIMGRFKRSAWYKKLASRERKESCSDFDRFRAMKEHRASFFKIAKAKRVPRKPKPAKVVSKKMLAKKAKAAEKAKTAKGGKAAAKAPAKAPAKAVKPATKGAKAVKA